MSRIKRGKNPLLPELVLTGLITSLSFPSTRFLRPKAFKRPGGRGIEFLRHGPEVCEVTNWPHISSSSPPPSTRYPSPGPLVAARWRVASTNQPHFNNLSTTGDEALKSRGRDGMDDDAIQGWHAKWWMERGGGEKCVFMDQSKNAYGQAPGHRCWVTKRKSSILSVKVLNLTIKTVGKSLYFN